MESGRFLPAAQMQPMPVMAIGATLIRWMLQRTSACFNNGSVSSLPRGPARSSGFVHETAVGAAEFEEIAHVPCESEPAVRRSPQHGGIPHQHLGPLEVGTVKVPVEF